MERPLGGSEVVLLAELLSARGQNQAAQALLIHESAMSTIIQDSPHPLPKKKSHSLDAKSLSNLSV